jgi:hypothetical protein
MTVLAGACTKDPETSNILCHCCPLPSITKFVTQYLSVEPAPEGADPSVPERWPQACPILSKGKGLLDIYCELLARKK